MFKESASVKLEGWWMKRASASTVGRVLFTLAHTRSPVLYNP